MTAIQSHSMSVCPGTVDSPVQPVRGASPYVGATTEISPAIRSWRTISRSTWARREIVAFLAWRDIRARYHQTILGTFWTLVQPLATTLVYAVVFGKLVKIQSDGFPYPIFVMTGLVPWTFMATAIQRSSTSLVANGGLIKKVAFPRLAVPMAAVLTGLVEFGAACIVLIPVMLYYSVFPSLSLLFLPVILVLSGAMILGVGLLLASINCRFRDVTHGIAFAMQMWMFLTPIIYPFSSVPERYQGWVQCNPMTGLIGGFRAALLGTPLDMTALGLSAAFAALFLTIGGAAFRRAEHSAADVL
ncbi:MAG: ABC transporter permease [Phycisphaerae bacterium]|nr:ABC transporter permease [Phycisphaerae bacterium]